MNVRSSTVGLTSTRRAHFWVFLVVVVEGVGKIRFYGAEGDMYHLCTCMYLHHWHAVKNVRTNLCVMVLRKYKMFWGGGGSKNMNNTGHF